MNLISIRDNFIVRYKLECLKKSVAEIDLSRQNKVIATMIYDAVNEIQTRLGVIEDSETVNLIPNTNQYELECFFGEPKVVASGNIVLKKRTTNWINEKNQEGLTNGVNPNGLPDGYAIVMVKDIYMGTKPNILVYPTPQAINSLTITYKSSPELFDPSMNDDAYSTDYPILPSQYDKAILFYMIDSMFGDNKPNFEREMMKLKVIKYNGSNMNEYIMN